MDTSTIDFSQFDPIQEGQVVTYTYNAPYFYQHLEELCRVLSKHYRRDIQWGALETNPYGSQCFSISLADPNTPKEPSGGFDFRPFDGLKRNLPVLYACSHSRHSSPSRSETSSSLYRAGMGSELYNFLGCNP